MKIRKLPFLALIVGIALSLQGVAAATTRTVDRPLFIVSNNDAIEVSRVELSDTATVLHISASYRPKKWIRIAPTSTLTDDRGRTYALRSAVGIKPGEKFYMPESGQAEFALVFQPVADGASSIDFSENSGEDGEYKIWGIQLRDTVLPPPSLPAWAVVHEPDTVTHLPVPELKYGMGTVCGRILDYRPGMDKDFEIICFAGNAIPIGISTENLPVQPDGSFSLSFPVVCTTQMQIKSMNRWRVNCFVSPGDTTEVIINMREICRQASRFHSGAKPYGSKAYVRGPLAQVAQDMNNGLYGVEYINKSMTYPDFVTVGMPQICEFYKQCARLRTAEWQRRPGLSLASRELGAIDEQSDLAYLMVAMRNDISRIRSRGGCTWGKKACDPKIIADSLRLYMPTPAMKQLPYDTRSMLSLNFHRFLDVATDADVKALVGPHTAAAEGTVSLLPDMVTASRAYVAINRSFEPLSGSQLVKVERLPEALRTLVMTANDSLLAAMELNKQKTGYTVHEAPNTTDADSLFAAIIAPWRGRVVLVDFWNTWCAPCRMGHESMRPLKQEMAGDSIVYINIANHSSREDTWKYFIADISGEHYRLDNKQWAALCRKFSIRGIPSYVFVGRDGTVRHMQTGFPGVQAMRSRLSSLVGE